MNQMEAKIRSVRITFVVVMLKNWISTIFLY